MKLLGDNTVTIPEYDKKLFNPRALLEWVKKMSGYKTVYKHPIFHKLERIEDYSTLLYDNIQVIKYKTIY